MNKVTTTKHLPIFETPIENDELHAINALISKHRANAALTQQLALDASRLVTTSQERLANQSEAGFFRRLASAITGKTRENQLMNQQDMLQMQKFAWHYLQQLQQQNLINAQSIAVIRNNLGTMNEYIIETRDFLEQAIDKIDIRLRHVENNTGFNNWALNIEANKRRFKSTPKTFLILRLAYDFMANHQNLVLTERNISNYLVTTLEKLDVNCDEGVKLLDFISELIDQIEIVGIDQYRAMIGLSFNEHLVSSEYVQKNISGIGFNALYFLSDHYEKIIDMVDDDQLCNSDEAREKIISKFFGNEFSGLSSTYSIRNLICEIIGGSQLAIDIYKDEHKLNAPEEEMVEETKPEVIELVSSLPIIQSHTFFDSQDSEDSKRNYLLLLALCVENSSSLNQSAINFLKILTEKAGIPELQGEILQLADSPRKYNDYQPIMQMLLDNENKKYTWLLDAFFLLTLAQRPIENSQIKMIIGIIKPAELKECLQLMLVTISASDASEVLKAGHKLVPFTQGWMNIIKYRELHFEKYFAKTTGGLHSTTLKYIDMLGEMYEVYNKGMEHAVFISFSDGSFMSRFGDKATSTLCSMGRKAAVASLNDFRQKATNFISENRSALSQANSMISSWNISTFEFKDEIQYSNFELDNSAENEDWSHQFEHYYHQIERTLKSFSQACDDAMEQLLFFIQGEFDKSVIKLREQKHTEYLRQKELEKQENKCVTITIDDKEHLLSIEWQQIKNPPCAPEDISKIKTDGKIWIIIARIKSDDILYRSEDGINWQQLQFETSNIKTWYDGIDTINGTWIVKNRGNWEGAQDDGFYYSIDAITWRYCPAPEKSKRRLSINDGQMYFENIFYFNGLWLWCGHQFQKYSYTEKGLFSDSTKTDSYRKLIIYCSQTLDGPWNIWEHSPQLPEGAEVLKMCSLPSEDAILAFCEYNSSYIRNKKRPEKLPFTMHFADNKKWRECAWGGRKQFYSSNSLSFFKTNDKFICFHGDEILYSDKGYDWSVQEKSNLCAIEYYPLNTFSIITSAHYGGSVIYVSQDAMLFKELKLDEGTWRHLTANEMGILGVYNVNQHEVTVLRVGQYIYRAKD